VWSGAGGSEAEGQRESTSERERERERERESALARHLRSMGRASETSALYEGASESVKP
jgi:hypothetical protein